MTPALHSGGRGRCRGVRGQHDLQGEVEDSQGYTEKHRLKRNKEVRVPGGWAIGIYTRNCRFGV